MIDALTGVWAALTITWCVGVLGLYRLDRDRMRPHCARPFEP